VLEYLFDGWSQRASDKMGDILIDGIVSCAAVLFRALIEERDKLGWEPAPQSIQFAHPAVFVLHIQRDSIERSLEFKSFLFYYKIQYLLADNSNDVVLAEPQLIIVVPLKIE